jgi:hypothetical protein
MKFEIPKPMKIEHDELHTDLVKATKAGGKTAEAAKEVAKVLHSHFVKEEEYALPPLGLLVALSEGKFETSMAEVLKMTDKLEAELPTMLSEHKDIVAALKKLIDAAEPKIGRTLCILPKNLCYTPKLRSKFRIRRRSWSVIM